MERDHDDCRARLPDPLLAHVVWPVRMEAHHDDGVVRDSGFEVVEPQAVPRL